MFLFNMKIICSVCGQFWKYLLAQLRHVSGDTLGLSIICFYIDSMCVITSINYRVSNPYPLLSMVKSTYNLVDTPSDHAPTRKP